MAKYNYDYNKEIRKSKAIEKKQKERSIKGDKSYKIYCLENVENNKKFIGHTQDPDVKAFVDNKVRKAMNKKTPINNFEKDVFRMVEKYGETIALTLYVVRVIDILPEDTPLDTVKHTETLYQIKNDTFFGGLNERIGNINMRNYNEILDTMVKLYISGVSAIDLAILMDLDEECIKILLMRENVDISREVVNKAAYTYARLFGNEPPIVEQKPKLIDPPFTIRF